MVMMFARVFLVADAVAFAVARACRGPVTIAPEGICTACSYASSAPMALMRCSYWSM
jgi:hypothetical protein